MDLLGFAFEAERRGLRVRVALPDAPDAFSSLPDGIADQWLPSFVPAGPIFNEPDRDVRTLGLIIFEVTVEVATDVPSPKPAELTPELREIVERDLGVGSEIATQVADLFVRHVRAMAPRQSWLGLSAHAPEQYGPACLLNRETGEFLFGLGPMQSVTMRSSQLRLDRADLSAVLNAISEDIEPGIAESLLADAWHLSDASGANDRNRAWIVAAVACEVRVKREIRQRAGTDRLDLVELLLRRRSNLPELLDEVWRAVLGKSLRTEDPALFEDIKSLTLQRNRLVHVGKGDPRVGTSLDPAHVAQALFDWLNAF
jgi:hypothetical protein